MGRDKKKQGAKGLLDKFRELITATEEEDDIEDEDELEESDDQIDITNKEEVRAVQKPRPVMEEIFSTTEETVRDKNVNPLELEENTAAKLRVIDASDKEEKEDKPKLTVITPETVEQYITKEQEESLTNLEEFLKGAEKSEEDEFYEDERPKDEEEYPDGTADVEDVKSNIENIDIEIDWGKEPEEPKEEESEAFIEDITVKEEEKDEKSNREINEEIRQKLTVKKEKAEKKETPLKKKQAKKKKPLGKSLKQKLKAAITEINAKPDEFMPDYLYGQEKDGVVETAVQEPSVEAENTEPVKEPVKKAEKKEPVRKEPPKAVETNQKEKPGKKAKEELPKKEEKQQPKENKANADKSLGSFEKQFGTIEPSDKGERHYVNGAAVPAYIPDGQVKHINTLSGRFSATLREEYSEYLKKEEPEKEADGNVIKAMLDNSVSETEEYDENGTHIEYRRAPENPEKPAKKKSKKKKKEKKPKKKAKKADEEEESKDSLNLKDRLFGSYDTPADYSMLTSSVSEDDVTKITDYESPADTKAVRAEINLKLRKLSAKSVATIVFFVLSLCNVVGQKFFPKLLTEYVPNVDLVYCAVSFLFLIITICICHDTIKNGLKPLLGFKGNSDTVLAVASIITAVQGIFTFFEPTLYFGGKKNTYALLVIFALMLNIIGKHCLMKRVRANFKFISSPGRKYTAKNYEDQKTAKKMTGDMNGDEPVVVFQRKTGFCKGFLRLSYMPDPSERVASKFAPYCILLAVAIAIIYGIMNVSITGAVSAMSVVCCVSVPVCCLLAVNLPLKRLCKKTLKKDGMVVGYPAVKHFSDTNAIMLDSKALFPRGRVELESVRTFLSYKIDNALLSAAAVLKAANTSLTYLFEDIILDRADSLPIVESVSYEDEKGLVAWVNGERMLIGNRELLQKYGIEPPSMDYEEKYSEGGKKITYLANSGQLIAMFVINYKADKRIISELRRLEKNGVRFLIRTADPNITQDGVAREFKIFYRSVQILPTVYGNICKEESSKKEKASRCYIATGGKMVSLARAVSGCIKIKNAINLSVVIQFIAVVFALLFVTAVVIASGLESIGVFEMFVYTALWAAVTVTVPLLLKS